eukprot:CAMPEP_0172697296 /NCGR_PEP_ID=MMETSP1074-20121228/28660_1 /TAXON_ID=2916 /ORGANISM="Ceratium fusus, Strain PA161109" /LENGTH=54 /DNA_ID=CAMNT_0013518175 /DNA_START=95 /DNA_END=256 /DNA_ORIENTATION=+
MVVAMLAYATVLSPNLMCFLMASLYIPAGAWMDGSSKTEQCHLEYAAAAAAAPA